MSDKLGIDNSNIQDFLYINGDIVLSVPPNVMKRGSRGQS